MKKKKDGFLEISLDFESKCYLECLQANLVFFFYFFEKKERDDQLKLFFLDKSETPNICQILDRNSRRTFFWKSHLVSFQGDA